MGQLINISICLSDLPKESITIYEKNGKKYISLVVDEKKEPDQYGKTHSVYVSQSKEERDAKTAKAYVGHGKAFNFNANSQSGTSTHQTGKVAENGLKQPIGFESDPNDDLPF